ncbi:MAG: putative rane protein, partial [Candidatus Eremiobacteraeota bacterium]|nr:putative rane protein [Candidatus Eremiobacteraeota bacterium]
RSGPGVRPRDGRRELGREPRCMESTVRETHVEATVRDHLANERTFLAYVRTSLAMVGFGFVIARLDPTSALSLAAGGVLVLGGTAMALFGAYRYVRERRALIDHRWHTLRPTAAVAIAAGCGAFGLFAVYALIRLTLH